MSWLVGMVIGLIIAGTGVGVIMKRTQVTNWKKLHDEMVEDYNEWNS